MLLRVYLFALLFSSAILVVRAADQEDDEEAPVNEIEPKLEERDGGYQSESWSGKGKSRGGTAGSRGASKTEINKLIGKGRPNKRINLGTKFLGTKYSRSSSKSVVKSRKDNYYRKNFVNTVESNLRLLRKKVHVHKHITYKRPLTVDNIKVHQQTNYIKNVYPQLDKLYIKKYGTVVQPARLITIERTASASRRNVKHPLQVHSASRNVHLGTKFERTKFLGIRSIFRNGNNFAGNGLSRGGASSISISLSKSGKGGNRGSSGGSYGSYRLNERAAQVAPQEITIEPEEHVLDESSF